MGVSGGSKSSSSSTTSADQTSLSADGVVTGKVFNISQPGQAAAFNYTDQFPQTVADIFSQLIDLTGAAGQAALDASQNALTQTQQYAQTAKQPDLDLVKTQNSYLPWILGGAGIVLVLILRRR